MTNKQLAKLIQDFYEAWDKGDHPLDRFGCVPEPYLLDFALWLEQDGE